MSATRAVLYARFSPRPNAEACESVESQLADLHALCGREGLPIASERWDKELSGGDRERAGLLAAVADCRRGDVLLVRDWSRLGRDTLFVLTIHEELQHRKCALRSMTEGLFSVEGDPAREVLSTVLAAVAKMQRALIRDATSRKMLGHQRNGRLMGSICPYGTMEGEPVDVGAGELQRRLVECPAEAAVIRRIVELHGSGCSLRGICRVLASEGLHSREGNGWKHQVIKAILERAGANGR